MQLVLSVGHHIPCFILPFVLDAHSYLLFPFFYVSWFYAWCKAPLLHCCIYQNIFLVQHQRIGLVFRMFHNFLILLYTDFDLEKEKGVLDEQGLRIAENQENSQKNRRKLAESTRGIIGKNWRGLDGIYLFCYCSTSRTALSVVKFFFFLNFKLPCI